MRKFKLLALSVSGKNNRVFNKKKDTVILENQLENPDYLVKEGFIEKLIDEDSVGDNTPKKRGRPKVK